MPGTVPKKRKKTVMVVDDDLGILDVMRLMLERAGYQVTTTTDGDNLRNLKEPLPDFLFLDILLSGEDGGKLCKHLKSRHQTKKIPVIMISANKNIKGISNTCGADGFLMKPLQMKEMLALVERHTA